jgi:hypothetical protein
MRHQTGLRNRYRSGRSPYSIKRKGLQADTYGSYSGGTLTRAENVAGKTISAQLPSRNRSND